MDERFKHDVFVSYAVEDRSWAQDFYDLLAASGVAKRIFFDRNSLRAGDAWEAKLQDAVRYSRHLVVLWSSAVKAGGWVPREMELFWMHAKPAENPERRMIIVNMDGAPRPSHSQLQHISLQELQDAYGNGHGHGRVDAQEVWAEAMRAVLLGLNPDVSPLQVSIVVLTLTRQQLEELQPDRKEWIPEFGVSHAEIAQQYGLTRSEWKPLGGNESIDTLLTPIKREIERGLGGRPVTWHEPDTGFWDPRTPNQATKFASEVFGKCDLAVLVIDPIVICHPDIANRLVSFQESFARSQTVVVVLPPVGMPMLTKLREALLKLGPPCFEAYFKPAFPPSRMRLAQYSMNTSDADDMRRHLLAAVGGLVTEHESPARSPFLRQGGP